MIMIMIVMVSVVAMVMVINVIVFSSIRIILNIFGSLDTEQARKLQATLDGCHRKLRPPTDRLTDGGEV